MIHQHDTNTLVWWDYQKTKNETITHPHNACFRTDLWTVPIQFAPVIFWHVQVRNSYLLFKSKLQNPVICSVLSSCSFFPSYRWIHCCARPSRQLRGKYIFQIWKGLPYRIEKYSTAMRFFVRLTRSKLQLHHYQFPLCPNNLCPAGTSFRFLVQQLFYTVSTE